MTKRGNYEAKAVHKAKVAVEAIRGPEKKADLVSM
jgi:hypothetical protein